MARASSALVRRLRSSAVPEGEKYQYVPPATTPPTNAMTRKFEPPLDGSGAGVGLGGTRWCCWLDGGGGVVYNLMPCLYSSE